MPAALYRLVKPGIVYGNLFSAVAGFLLGAALAGRFELVAFAAGMAGTALVIAAGCVINNITDRSIDKKMERTKRRGLVTGQVSVRLALGYAGLLLAVGFGVLALGTNGVVVALGALGFMVYVLPYAVAKRRGSYGALVGSISGATPIAAGYAAATGQFDAVLVALFLVMACWQMPHFYSIAIYRRAEYAQAGLPVLPIKRSLRTAKWHIFGFTVVYGAAVLALAIAADLGYVFAAVMAGLCAQWLWLAARGFAATDHDWWARRMFGFSLHVLVVFCALISIDIVLP